MASQTTIGSTKVPVALPFLATDIANASGTLTTLAPTVNEYVMPVGGSVIGMSASLDGTLTTGTMTFSPTVNGVASSTAFYDTLMTGESKAQSTLPSQQVLFNAGDTVGLMWAKTGSIAPTTRDAAALLIILLDNYDY